MNAPYVVAIENYSIIKYRSGYISRLRSSRRECSFIITRSGKGEHRPICLNDHDLGRRDNTDEGEERRTTRLGAQMTHDGRRQDKKRRHYGYEWPEGRKREREREHDADGNDPYIRSIKLTQRAAPSAQRPGRELLGTPTGHARLIRQAAHVSNRLHARPETPPRVFIYMKTREGKR